MHVWVGCEQAGLTGIPNELLLGRIDVEISVTVISPVDAGYSVALSQLGAASPVGMSRG